MGKLEKYLESREPASHLVQGTYSIQEKCRAVKRRIDWEWDKYCIRQNALHGEEPEETDTDKLIYYLVKKGIL
ncbi:MAG TPA: hypothetical protein ENI07_01135 [Desulfobacterales bacterium]|nr:hypothetical protein [Desulfobacterales bacterium]